MRKEANFNNIDGMMIGNGSISPDNKKNTMYRNESQQHSYMLDQKELSNAFEIP